MDKPTATGVSREAVEWCYKLFLGREPASQEVADSHLARPSLESLRAFFATHPEFQAYQRRLGIKLASVNPSPPARPVGAVAAAAPSTAPTPAAPSTILAKSLNSASAATAPAPSPIGAAGPAPTPPAAAPIRPAAVPVPEPKKNGWLPHRKRR